jgi:hypothetical protein
MLQRRPTWVLLLACAAAVPCANCTEVPLHSTETVALDDSPLNPNNGARPDAGGGGSDSQLQAPSDAGAEPEEPDAGDRDSGPIAPLGCTVPSDVNNAPSNYPEMLALINALPRPATVACFLQALARPLEVTLTRSLVSLQPAVGARSPRVFIFYGPMIYSVVPDGAGAVLLEMGYMTSDTRTVKAEVVFPRTETLDEASVGEHILRENGTVCRLCHGDETLVEGDDFFKDLYESDAFKPRPEELVTIQALTLEEASCDPALEPQRCAILDALLNYGPLVERAFPEGMPTFY